MPLLWLPAVWYTPHIDLKQRSLSAWAALEASRYSSLTWQPISTRHFSWKHVSWEFFTLHTASWSYQLQSLNYPNKLAPFNLSGFVCFLRGPSRQKKDSSYVTRSHQRRRNSQSVTMKNVFLRPPPAIVQIYNCERDTFRLSVCPLCGALRDPREAFLVSAGRTVYHQRTDNPFCRDGATDNP